MYESSLLEYERTVTCSSHYDLYYSTVIFAILMRGVSIHFAIVTIYLGLIGVLGYKTLSPSECVGLIVNRKTFVCCLLCKSSLEFHLSEKGGNHLRKNNNNNNIKKKKENVDFSILYPVIATVLSFGFLVPIILNL